MKSVPIRGQSSNRRRRNRFYSPDQRFVYARTFGSFAQHRRKCYIARNEDDTLRQIQRTATLRPEMRRLLAWCAGPRLASADRHAACRPDARPQASRRFLEGGRLRLRQWRNHESARRADPRASAVRIPHVPPRLRRKALHGLRKSARHGGGGGTRAPAARLSALRLRAFPASTLLVG